MFNKDILKYCITGLSTGKDRRAIVSIKNLLMAQGVSTPVSFDSYGNYTIFNIGGNYVVDLYHNDIGHIKVSPEEYLYLLTGEPQSIRWYENLQVGDQVKIGWCSSSIADYHFAFDLKLIHSHVGENFIISNIVPMPAPNGFPKWFNGDINAYYVQELDHWLPSSVFVPVFGKRNPVISIELKEISALKALDIL